MVPFWSLFFVLTWKIANSYLDRQWRQAFFLLCLADPTLLSQLLLIGPDLALMAFFLLAFWGHRNQQPYLQMAGILGLALLSMRGMMCAAALFLFEGISEGFRQKWQPAWWWRQVRIYSPGFLLAGTFLLLHLSVKGWMGYHPDSPWALSFQKNTANEAGRHLLILGWRLLDFGRVFLWLALLLIWRKLPGSRKWKDARLALLLLVMLTWPFIVYQGVNQHRYLLPFYGMLHLLFLQQLGRVPWRRWAKNLLFVVVLAGLVSGHLWIYPSSLAQGWDSSLAHRPYFRLRQSAEAFLQGEGIPFTEVGTAFPAIGPLRNFDPEQSGPGFGDKDSQNYDYYLVSNIMNGYATMELKELQAHFQLLFHRQQNGIYVSIYGKKKEEPGGIE